VRLTPTGVGIPGLSCQQRWVIPGHAGGSNDRGSVYPGRAGAAPPARGGRVDPLRLGTDARYSPGSGDAGDRGLAVLKERFTPGAWGWVRQSRAAGQSVRYTPGAVAGTCSAPAHSCYRTTGQPRVWGQVRDGVRQARHSPGGGERLTVVQPFVASFGPPPGVAGEAVEAAMAGRSDR